MDWQPVLDQIKALSTRMDAMDARMDAATLSGTKVLESAQEMNLGRQGYGEVEFWVEAKYTVEFTLKRFNIYSWSDGDHKPVRKSDAPVAAIEAALRKLVDRQPRRFMDDLGEKF